MSIFIDKLVSFSKVLLLRNTTGCMNTGVFNRKGKTCIGLSAHIRGC